MSNFFDSESAEALVCQYQATGNLELLGQAIEQCQPITLSLVRSRASMAFVEETELTSRVDRKLAKSLSGYRPERGRLFSFATRIAVNEISAAVTYAKKHQARFTWINPVVEEHAFAPTDTISESQTRDLAELIRAEAKSTCQLESERAAQRWYIDSFLDCEFSLERFRYASAAEKVFSLGRMRARDLYDFEYASVPAPNVG
jgi:hypothetical protein